MEQPSREDSGKKIILRRNLISFLWQISTAGQRNIKMMHAVP